ncbi:MAG: hypothetical protein Q8N88_05905 [Nanoarchaeota archaeon]|nr:hypothetical protein [Nanoarchaeota archaeon]
MIRLGVRVSRAVQYVLFKIKGSLEYDDFKEKLKKAKIEGEGNVPMKQYRIFETAKDRILKRIGESTREILMQLIVSHKSTKKEGLYRRRAIKGYERYIRTLLKRHIPEILPEIYEFLEKELDEGIDFFRIGRMV